MSREQAPTWAEVQSHVDRFLHALNVLVGDLVARFPGDAVIYRARKRITAAIALDQLNVIQTLGEYLFPYREQIWNFGPKNEQFFMESTFDRELKEADPEKANVVLYIMPKVKETARGMQPAEKVQYVGFVTDLLDEYLEYLTAVEERDLAAARGEKLQ